MKKAFGSAGSMSGFGFTPASVSGSQPLFGAAVDDYSSFSGELKVILKRLSKRDSVTKIKALEDLKTHVSNLDTESLNSFVVVWPKLFNKLAVDPDRRVREVTLQCHLIIVTAVKKGLAPILKEIIGTWLCCQFDTSKEAAKSAVESLNVAFPNKISNVLAFCQKEVLSYVSDNILVHKPETLSDARFTSEEDMISKYVQIVSSSFNILAMMFDQLSTSELEKCKEDYDILLNETTFWESTSSPHSNIRRSMYKFIKGLSSLSSPSPLEGYQSLLIKHFLGKCFTDKEASVHGDMWDAILLLTKAFPQMWIRAQASESKKGNPIKGLLSFLKNGCYGSGTASYPALVVLMASLPEEVLANESDKVGVEVLNSIWKGLSSGQADRQMGPALIDAYFDCLLVFNLKLSKLGEVEMLQTVAELQMKPFTALFFPNMVPEIVDRVSDASLSKSCANYFVILSRKMNPTDYSRSILSQFLKSSIINGIARAESPDGNKIDNAGYGRLCDSVASYLDHMMGLDVGERYGEEFKRTLAETLFIVLVDRLLNTTEHANEAASLMLRITSLFSPTTLLTEEVADKFRGFVLHNSANVLQATKSESLLRLIVNYLPLISRGENDDVMDIVLSNLISKDKRSLLVVIDEVSRLPQKLNLTSSSLEKLCTNVASSLLSSCDSVEIDILEKALMMSQDRQLLSLDSQHQATDSIFTFLKTSLHNETDVNAGNSSNDALAIALKIAKSLISSSSSSFWALPKAELTNAISTLADFVVFKSDLSAEVKMLVGSIWDLLEQNKSAYGDLKAIVSMLCKQMKDALLSLKYNGSPDQFADLASKIFLFAGDDAACKNIVVQMVTLDEAAWCSISEPHVSSTAALSILDRGRLLNTAASNPPTLQKGEYDANGISIFTRAVSTLISFICSIGVTYYTDLGGTPEAWMFEVELFKRVLSDEASLGFSTLYRTTPKATFNQEQFLDKMNSIYSELTESASSDWHTQIVQKLDSELCGDAAHAEDSLSLILLSGLRRNVKNGSLQSGLVFSDILRNIFERVPFEDDGDIWCDLLGTLEEAGLNQALLPLLNLLKGTVTSYGPLKNLLKKCVSKCTKLTKADMSSPANISLATSCILIVSNVIEFDEDMEELMSADVIMNLTRRIRMWVSNSEGMDLANIPIALQSAFAIFFERLVKVDHDFDVNSAAFIVEFGRTLLESSDIVSLFYGLKLVIALMSAVTSNPDTWGAISRYDLEILKKYARLLLVHAAPERLEPYLSKPVMELQNLLCEVCSGISDDILGSLQAYGQLCRLLYTHNLEVQLSVFRLLKRLTASTVQSKSLKLELNTSDASIEETFEAKLLEGAARTAPEIEPGVDVHDTSVNAAFGYLLTWMIIFDHFEDATFDLKTCYLNELRQNEETVGKFLEYILEILGVGWSNAPFDLSKWDFTELEVEGVDITSEVGFPLLSAYLFWRSLQSIPSIVRTWWSNCKRRQLSLAVESYVERHFTPPLIAKELAAVNNLDASTFEDMTVRASKTTQEITATYTIEEASVEIVLKLPRSFPLKNVDVTGQGGRSVGIPDSKWRSWLMGAGILAQNGGIVDALGMLRKNISLHFEGKEDCAICYSVISAIDKTLPTKACRTCKNVFHGSCLFKWFKSSNSSTCPLCRQIF
ncbi:hypothetical protein HDV05_008430 [Chytridiales sp. JEL 0842]|nr:hypothetical protein HDV05_008430 [Chytridiales sp. JEL 0842]